MWYQNSTGAAATAVTLTEAGKTNQRISVAAYSVVLSGADLTQDVTVQILDVNNAVLWRDILPNGSVKGDRCAYNFGLNAPQLPEGSSARLVCSQPNAGSILTCSMHGYTDGR